MIFNFYGKTKLYVSGEDYHSTKVLYGFLSILSFNFDHVQAGFYLSNETGCPFAYRVKSKTINVLLDRSDSIEK